MNARRLVTGHDDDGKAVVVSDEMVAPVTLALLPGGEFHQLWGTDSTMRFPDDGTIPLAPRYFPPVGGCRFMLFTVAPDAGPGLPEDLDLGSALAEFEQKLPGLAEYLEPDSPGMHTSATVDFGVVLSGQVTLELDYGTKVTLNVGDTYVQNGTRHRWSNAGEGPAVIALVAVGADHDTVT